MFGVGTMDWCFSVFSGVLWFVFGWFLMFRGRPVFAAHWGNLTAGVWVLRDLRGIWFLEG